MRKTPFLRVFPPFVCAPEKLRERKHGQLDRRSSSRCAQIARADSCPKFEDFQGFGRLLQLQRLQRVRTSIGSHEPSALTGSPGSAHSIKSRIFATLSPAIAVTRLVDPGVPNASDFDY
jgi:hypothetical protein